MSHLSNSSYYANTIRYDKYPMWSWETIESSRTRERKIFISIVFYSNEVNTWQTQQIITKICRRRQMRILKQWSMQRKKKNIFERSSVPFFIIGRFSSSFSICWELEILHFFRTLARNRIRRAFYSYGQLPEAHKRLVPTYETHLAQLLKCIDRK